jgi:hypothetical protein
MAKIEGVIAKAGYKTELTETKSTGFGRSTPTTLQACP